jgi:hypothetical protein
MRRAVASTPPLHPQTGKISSMGLADPYLKTTRAKEHLEALREALQLFYDSNPCRFVREDDVERQMHVIIAEFARVPDKIPLIAGDVFYCLRASLDHLVWCLAKLSMPNGYPENTQFPILEKPDALLFKRRTKGVSAGALTIIESLQPYAARDADAVRRHPLWRLNKLCNIDKHMRIPVHGVLGRVRWNNVLPYILKGFDKNNRMEFPLDLKNSVALNPRVPEIKVVFGDHYWKIECDMEGIDAIYEFVTDKVIPRFARFF